MSITDAVLETVRVLSPEQQRQVLRYAQSLQREQREKFLPASDRPQKNGWRNHPFVGMWKDREDMQDSVEWVRQVRQKEWRGS